MSLVLYGGGVLDARGSVSGITMSRSKFGATQRSKTSPTQPKANLQGQARSLLSYVSNYWAETLNDSERAAWNSYALTSPRTNVFGQVSYLSGHQMFCALTVNIANVGGTIQPIPPVATSYPSILTLSLMTSGGGTPLFSLTYTVPVLTGTPYLYVFASDNLSPGISNANNKLRFIGAQALGTSPQSFLTEWTARFGSNVPRSNRRQFALATVIDQDTGLSGAGIIASAIAL